MAGGSGKRENILGIGYDVHRLVENREFDSRRVKILLNWDFGPFGMRWLLHRLYALLGAAGLGESESLSDTDRVIRDFQYDSFKLWEIC